MDRRHEGVSPAGRMAVWAQAAVPLFCQFHAIKKARRMAGFFCSVLLPEKRTYRQPCPCNIQMMAVSVSMLMPLESTTVRADSSGTAV